MKKLTHGCAKLALAVFVLLLAACGGGGGGGGGGAPDLTSAPGITIAPTSLSFAAVHNGALPSTQDVQITISAPNAAFVGVAVPAGNPPTWLDYQNQGRLSGSGNNWTFTAAILTTGLAPGTYTTTVSIGIADAGQNILAFRNVQVSYTVQPMTGFSANPLSLSFSQLQGAAVPAPQSVAITESGGASYPWNASIVYQSGSGWLNVNGAASASGGTLPTSLTMSINSSPTLGTLNALIRVTGNGNTLDVPVSYTVTEPGLTRSPSSLTFNASSGQGAAPATQDVTLSTQGNLPLNYTTSVTYGAGAMNWLDVSASGTAPNPLTVGVKTTNLVQGSYNATLSVNTPGGQTLSVAITYTLVAPTLTLNPSPVSFTINSASQAAALSQSVSVGSTGAALSWTAASSDPWVTVPSSGTSGSPITVNLNAAQLDPLDAGTRSATITFSYTPPGASATTASLTVNLNLQLPKVNYVSPYVQLPSTSTEVILRGSGFNNATGDMLFGATPVSTYTVDSDTQIRVVHPSLTAGSYQVRFSNQLGLTRSRASLLVAAAPTVTSASLPTLLEPIRIVYDAERVTAFANNIGNNGGGGGTPRIDRHRFSAGTWTTDSLQLPDGLPLDIALTPDGLELIAVSPSSLYHIDAATFTISRQITHAAGLPLLTFFSSFDKLAMGNDGNVLVFVNSPALKPYLYNVLTQTFTQAPIFNLPDSSVIATAGSIDGSRVLFGTGAQPNLYFYDAATAQIASAVQGLVINRLALDRTGTISVVDGVAYNRTFTILGSGGINLSRAAVSPDGTRGYGVVPADSLGPVLHTYDLTGSGTFTQLPTIPLPDTPGERLVVGISSDGRTVFVASDTKFIVQPLP